MNYAVVVTLLPRTNPAPTMNPKSYHHPSFGKVYMRISENKPPIKENGEIRPCNNPGQKPAR
jgi:hypothetical protein